ncbi:MAG TPA: hypothetical protein VGO26_10560 [Amnibacterium sp.]|nr:hypothetical protein [Amnibacterium sp.]
MAWYGVRTVIEHPAKGGHLYEERVVLFDAVDEAAAFKLAEAEVADYCSYLEGAKPLGLCQLYVMDDEPVTSGTEVFSLMRTTHLKPSAYVKRFFKTGDELERD